MSDRVDMKPWIVWAAWVDAVEAVYGALDTDDPDVWAIWQHSYGDFMAGLTPAEMAAKLPNRTHITG
jgi:hypothetical protein